MFILPIVQYDQPQENAYRALRCGKHGNNLTSSLNNRKIRESVVATLFCLRASARATGGVYDICISALQHTGVTELSYQKRHQDKAQTYAKLVNFLCRLLV